MTDAEYKTDVAGPLNKLSAILVAAVTATSSVLALFGVSSNRAWVLLDDDLIRFWLLAAGLSAIAAVGLGLMSYLEQNPSKQKRKTALLFAGTCCYLGGMVAAVIGAATSADTAGRPDIVNLAVSRQGNGYVVAFEVVGSSFDNTDRMGVRLRHARDSEVLLEAYPRPTAGMVQLKASVPVRLSNDALLLQVWTIKKWGEQPRCPDDRAAARNRALVVADCVTLHLPADVPTR